MDIIAFIILFFLFLSLPALQKKNNKNFTDSWELNLFHCPNCGALAATYLRGHRGKALGYGTGLYNSLTKTFICKNCGYTW